MTILTVLKIALVLGVYVLIYFLFFYKKDPEQGDGGFISSDAGGSDCGSGGD